MTIVAPTALTAPPPAPSTNDPDNFDPKADALVAWLAPHVTEMTSAQAGVYSNALDAAASAAAAADGATTAAANATAAAAVGGITKWVSGTTYNQNVCAWSPTNGLTYRRTGTSGVSTTDPASDAANWTLQATALRELKATAAIVSNVLTMEARSANIFVVALNANITSFTMTGLPATGLMYGFILELVADGTARSVTWTINGVTVKWAGNILPVLTATNGKRDTFVLYTYDAGASWSAQIVGQSY
jgi:hypothetical protein